MAGSLTDAHTLLEFPFSNLLTDWRGVSRHGSIAIVAARLIPENRIHLPARRDVFSLKVNRQKVNDGFVVFR